MAREQYEGFIKDYEAICRKHGYAVLACGCCDSPWPVGDMNGEKVDEHLKHLRKESGFTKEEEKKATT